MSVRGPARRVLHSTPVQGTSHFCSVHHNAAGAVVAPPLEAVAGVVASAGVVPVAGGASLPSSESGCSHSQPASSACCLYSAKAWAPRNKFHSNLILDGSFGDFCWMEETICSNLKVKIRK